MEVDSLLLNVDFSNEEHRRQINGIIEEKLQQLMADSHSMPNIHEKLLVSAQEQVMPFISAILDFKSFHEFTDLKNVVDYVIACQQGDKEPPFPDMEHYDELCFKTAFIFDTDMEDECDGHEVKKYNRLRRAYYREIPKKDPETQIVAEYFWHPIFSEYYYFIGYFMQERNDVEKDRNQCRSIIIDILFDVLWDLDNECEHSVENSYFKRAVISLFAYEE